MTTHPDLEAEQEHLDHASACLETMRAKTEQTLSYGERAAAGPDSPAVQRTPERRAAALAETPAALCFGRLDNEDKERFYVGRRHVEGPGGDAVVVDWRAPVSVPFYRATFADPMELLLRRRFSIDNREIVDVFDEDFTDPDLAAGGGIPDPLLAELERARTGEMRDIVATIQAEQDAVIRASLDELVV